MEFIVVLGLILVTFLILGILIPWRIVSAYDKKTGKKRQEEFESYMKQYRK